MLAQKYNLGYLPTEESDIPNFSCKIDELNLSGLFGKSGTLSYINNELSPKDGNQESQIYDLDDIIDAIHDTVKFIEKELERLKIKKTVLDKKYKIAVDIDDTLLCTKELEKYYWNIFLQENPNIDSNKEYKWGDIEMVKFWSEYREKMAFGKIKEGATGCLDTLMKNGYIVDLLSARPLDKYASLKKRLVEYFEMNNLHYNYMHLGFYSKVDFLKQHNYDLLIDNDLRHIEQANSVGINTILYGPFNPKYLGYQTSDWNEIESIVEKICDEKN